MAGTITGSSEGNIEGLANSSTSTSNGLNYLDQFNGGVDHATEAISELLEGNYGKAIFKGALSLWNFGKSLTGNATDDYTTETKSTGNINMSFTGKISLDGYSTTNTSNNATGVEFSYTAFSQDDVVGKGVWSLAENPTVYIVDDCLLGDDEDLVCVVQKDGYNIGDIDPSSQHLHLMTFLDPTSIKINLNTSVYKNIRNTKMSWVYGVYPNQEAGHTDSYRNGMMLFNQKGLLKTPEFINKKQYADSLYKSYTANFANMTYLEYPLENMTMTYLSSDTKAKVFEQKDAKYLYYGHAGNNRKEDDENFFIVDPVVTLPTDYIKENEGDKNGKGMFYDMTVPDFVVGVTLTFDYTLDDGSNAKALFSKRFLPQTKMISTANLKKKREELQQYVQSGVHQRIGSLTINCEEASNLLRQFFSSSNFIINNTNK